MNKTNLYIVGLLIGGLFTTIDSFSSILGWCWIAIMIMLLFIIAVKEDKERLIGGKRNG